MRFDAVQTIKDQLTMTDVATHYGYKPNRAGFIKCPFHTEKTASMKIYAGDKGYACFGCGANGDVISFVQKLFGLTFGDALRKIDTDFCLNIYGNKSFEELRRSHRQNQMLQAIKQRKEWKRQQAEKEYWSVFDKWKRLDENKRKYAPKTPDEQWSPLYIEALRKLPYIEYLLEMAEIRWCNCE